MGVMMDLLGLGDLRIFKKMKGMVVVLRTKGQLQPYQETPLLERLKLEQELLKQMHMILTHPEKYFHKVPCRRCNGSGIAYWCDGEDAGRPNRLVGDKAVVKETRAALN